MKMIYLIVFILTVAQIGLIWYNLDVKISAVLLNNLSWWVVFIPAYVLIVIVGLIALMLSGLSM